MLKDNAKQQEGRSTFIHLYGGRVEVSLFLEVVQHSEPSVNRETLYSLKNQKEKQGHDCLCTSNPRAKKTIQLQEEVK